MTAGLRVGLAQRTPDRDPGVNLPRPSRSTAGSQTWLDIIYPAQALCNGLWWIVANQHGGAGTDRMLGGSRVIAHPLAAKIGGSLMSSRSSTEPVPLYYLLASRQVTRRLTASPEPARN